MRDDAMNMMNGIRDDIQGGIRDDDARNVIGSRVHGMGHGMCGMDMMHNMRGMMHGSPGIRGGIRGSIRGGIKRCSKWYNRYEVIWHTAIADINNI